ncbi:hypothetical protein ALNOE001_11690 [Candidatus Methanobinarius endosymbioticus]|uniref:Bacterial Ig-like domain-containing protein n=1 Tax=Candidatus Methanobinarius endosymbioticus TaxID=2006182 RepID=A0A366MA28_9EURY|nr:hypothetical protein ALNOE001_11690 [Candidatus Methanobinarius endosymbioticus]
MLLLVLLVNNIHLSFTNTTSFNVAKLNTNITGGANDSVVDEETIIPGTITDELGNPIANAELEIIVDGQKFTVTTNSTSGWSLKYTPKSPRTIDISVNFVGNGTFEGRVKSFSFNVKKRLDPKPRPISPIPDPIIPDPIPSNDTNKTSNDPPTAKVVVMKETGIPIITIILILISLIGLIGRRKKHKNQ